MKTKHLTMKNYFTHFGIWLGGLLLLAFILPFMGIYLPYIKWVGILAGTILGVVMTHKSEGDRINFGKAFGVSAMLIGGFAILNIIVMIVSWGADSLGFVLPFLLTELLISLMISISVLLATGLWYMFEKAGQPGYASIIPIYNIIVMCNVAKKPTWWVVMFFIPIANIVFLIMMLNGISKNFGKSSGFTVGLVFLNQIFFSILGYGDAQYLEMQAIPSNDDVLDSGDYRQ